MDRSLLEGTELIGKLAHAGKLEAFYNALDNDDLEEAAHILKSVDADQLTIQKVLLMIQQGDA